MMLSRMALATLLALACLPGSARAEPESLQSLQHKCDARDWAACDRLAWRHQSGESAPVDVEKARALRERACNAGFGPACTGLAFMYVTEALPKDDAKVLRLFTRACELKDGDGCSELGGRYLEGEGVPKDVNRALELVERGCDLKSGDACYELFVLYSNGKFIPKNPQRAEAYYEKSCDLMAAFCVMNFDELMQPLVAKCQGGDGNACHRVGDIHLNGESYLRPDEAMAAQYYKKACDARVAAGCAMLGWIHDLGTQTRRNRFAAAGYYQKACTGGDMGGCQSLGVLYLGGDGVAKDERRAAELFRTVCNANSPDTAVACGLLAECYHSGLGVPKDPARAMTFHAQACRLGVKQSCKAGSATVATAAPTPARPPAAGCSVVKVQLGADSFANVQRDITRRGGSAYEGTDNGKPTLAATSGDYMDVGREVMSVTYKFDGAGAGSRVTGVTVVTHAGSSDQFAKLLAARKTASAAVVGNNAHCGVRVVPDADTFFIYEIYELK